MFAKNCLRSKKQKDSARGVEREANFCSEQFAASIDDFAALLAGISRSLELWNGPRKADMTITPAKNSVAPVAQDENGENVFASNRVFGI